MTDRILIDRDEALAALNAEQQEYTPGGDCSEAIGDCLAEIRWLPTYPEPSRESEGAGCPNPTAHFEGMWWKHCPWCGERLSEA